MIYNVEELIPQVGVFSGVPGPLKTLDKNKHCKVVYAKAKKAVNKSDFKDLNELNGWNYETKQDTTVYEITKTKKTVYQNMPVQISCAIYQLAKLRMLQFYYDCGQVRITRRLPIL